MNPGRTLWRILFACYWIAMAIGSHWPRLNISERFGLENSYFSLGVDKWAHVIAYAGLAYLAMLAGLFRGTIKKQIVLTTVAGMAYSVVDELTQRFFEGREPSFNDFFASSLGVVIGCGVFLTTRWLLGGDKGLDNFVGHARLVSALTLVSRVLGLVRDRALAWAFGFGTAMDAFTIAFLVPNLFRRLFGEGALAAAFIPQYAKLTEAEAAEVSDELNGGQAGDEVSSEAGAGRGRHAANLLFMVLSTTGLILGSLAAASVMILLMLWYSAGLDERGSLTAQLTVVTIWYAPLVCLSAVLAAALQVHKRFAVPAISPVILNVTLITAAIVSATVFSDSGVRLQLLLVALAVVIAGLLQLAIHHTALIRATRQRISPRLGLRQTWSSDPTARGSAKRLMSQWAPTVFGLAVFQLNTLADAMIALFFSGPAGQQMNLFGTAVSYPMNEGAVGILGMAQRLYEFPLGVFAIAVATALFPRLAETAGDPERFTRLLRTGLRLTLFITIPASIGLILIRLPLSTVIYFPTGQITPADPPRIAAVLAFYAPGVWAYSMNQLFTRAFYALDSAQTPMRIGIAMVALNITLNLILIWPLGAAGLAASTTICAVIQTVILAIALKRRSIRPADAVVLGSAIKAIGLSVVMGTIVFVLVAPVDLMGLSFIRVATVLAAGTGFGAAAYLIPAKLMKLPELNWLISGKFDEAPDDDSSS